MRVVIRTDVDDDEREAIAWDLDHNMGMTAAQAHTTHSTAYRLPWRKRLAKRTEAADYLLTYGQSGLELSTSDYTGWRSIPTEAEANAGDKARGLEATN